MHVRITRTRPDVEIPEYKTPGSAAFDLASAVDMQIPPRTCSLVPTGLIIATPPDHVLLLTARSSLFRKKGLIPGNGVGTIDSDFCGPDDELQLILWNPGDTPVAIQKGERLVQGCVLPIVHVTFDEGPAEAPNRGGFGSTGGINPHTL